MRILHVSDSLQIGGLESVVVALANAQTERGHDVSVAAGDGSLWQELDPRIARFGGVGIRYAMPWQFLKIARLLHSSKWDIVHSHQRGVSTLIWLARRGSSIKHVEHVHNVFLPVDHRFSSFRGQILIPCGSQVRMMLESSYHRSPLILFEVRNGVPDHLFRARPGTSSTLRILNIARVSAQKDHSRWIQTVEQLHKLGTKVHARWVGDGDLLDAARTEVLERGLSGIIDFDGAERPAYARLAEADLFLSTSRWEGLPLSILESLAAGLPVVATNVGSVRDAVDDAVTGLLPPDDVSAESLAESIRQLAAVPERLAEMGRQARQLYEREFTFERMVERLDKCYGTLLARR